ncbi:response regulator receiver (CheY-like) modulated metal dependent phosphohydrolase [Nitrobacter hamburgensis X14]|uniref:Response regulator receiver (CheY-like) modulated metal dependent phosphohydrolase n=1 Tax=Nitrobacter hamburgensis (strain DSM 10229 / NCIMB 13809 / X14) TaxID=323097 RepID=Q1QGE6_NITHX|nr:HD domain-containing phosphohydrolase [Nitrobacter hamburgensis]ABE64701.1 response regulator receiver (CheY-like) modulated metal dependent phosphohydrolase [Nitrobacter hamburgensis X14]
MTTLTTGSSARRRLLLASDRSDRSGDLGAILQRVGDVDTTLTSEIPDTPAGRFAGIVVDINLRSAESVLRVRDKLCAEAYRSVPRLFVLADALHHGSMQAWALGATDTISRPFDAQAILQRIRSAFPGDDGRDAAASTKALNRGIAAAHAVLVKIFERLPAGVPLAFSDVLEAEREILRAIKRSSLRDWLAAVGRHHDHSYRHCLFVTGFAAAFAQRLGMREDDQRRLTRAALLHDVGKAFIPVAILDKPGKLSNEEKNEIRRHPRLGYEALLQQGGFPPEMLDVVLHHHELLDGSGYPDGLRGDQISDIVRLTTIVDIHAALIEQRAYRLPFTHAKSFAMMEEMSDKLDQHLLQAFRPVALGC